MRSVDERTDGAFGGAGWVAGGAAAFEAGDGVIAGDGAEYDADVGDWSVCDNSGDGGGDGRAAGDAGVGDRCADCDYGWAGVGGVGSGDAGGGRDIFVFAG